MGCSIRAFGTRELVRRLARPKVVIGTAVVALLILVGLFGPLLAPIDPNQQAIRETLRPPQGVGALHIFGTDNLGRDIFTRIIYGARISLLIALTVVTLSGVVGIVLGAISGYLGGRIDFAIQKAVEVVWAFPSLLLAIIIITFLGGGVANLILALVVQRWISYCRVVRGEVMALRNREFIQAARIIGASTPRIIRGHLLPNVVASSLVVATFSTATAIIAEASLSFLGLGVPPNVPTWGSMLADGRTYVSAAPWLSIFPGAAIFITVLGINLLGDGLRDIFDPRLKNRGN
jgi:peptide/nickel transport system permease protein